MLFSIDSKYSALEQWCERIACDFDMLQRFHAVGNYCLMLFVPGSVSQTRANERKTLHSYITFSFDGV
jgi:hypothetical protein